MIEWDKITKDDITINYVNGWSKNENNDCPGAIGIGWSCKGIGFGEITFAFDGTKFSVDTETMDKKFCMMVFEKMLETCKVE